MSQISTQPTSPPPKPTTTTKVKTTNPGTSHSRATADKGGKTRSQTMAERVPSKSTIDFSTDRDLKSMEGSGEEFSFSTVDLDKSLGAMSLNGKSANAPPKSGDETSFSAVDLDESAAETRSLGATALGTSHRSSEKSTTRRSGTSSRGRSGTYSVSMQKPSASSAQLAMIAESPRKGGESPSDKRSKTPKPKNETPRDPLIAEPKRHYGATPTATSASSTRGANLENEKLQRRAAQVLERAVLRDKLLAAVAAMDFRSVLDCILKIPLLMTDWHKYFPQEVPTVSNELLENCLSKLPFLMPRRGQLETYIHYVQERALGVRQAQTYLAHQTLTIALERISKLCIAFRDTPESQLPERANEFEQLMRSALDTGHGETLQLVERLAYQPLVAIQTLLDKSAVLYGHIDSTTLESFLSVVESVGTAQTASGESLRRCLLQEEVNVQGAVIDAKLYLAYSLTEGRDDDVAGHLSRPEIKHVHTQLREVIETFDITSDFHGHEALKHVLIGVVRTIQKEL